MAIKINTNIENDFDGYLLNAANVKGTYVVVTGVGDDTKENIYESTKVVGTLAYDANLDTTYRWDGTTWVEVDGGTAGSCLKQVQVLPTITTENLGKIFQYIGETTVDYIKGYIYEAKNLGTEETPDYKWVAVSGASDISSIKYTNENATTKDLGGIAKGTTFDNVPLDQLLTDLLYPYVAYEVKSVTSTDAAGTFEYGSTKTIESIKPTITTGSQKINSLVVKDAAGNTIYTGTEAVSGTTYTLTTSVSLDGTTDSYINVSFSDGKTSVTKKLDYKFTKSIYYAQTADTTMPTSGTAGNDVKVTFTDFGYLWFFSPTAKTKIQQYVTGQWNNVDTNAEGTLEFTLSTGAKLTYYAYRTNKLSAHTGEYQLI